MLSNVTPVWIRTGTFRAQDLSFPKTNSPYGELSFPRLFVPGNFRSLGTKVPWNFRSRALSFSGTFVPGERKFLGTFVPWTFRSEELSFLRLRYTRHWLWTQRAIATVRICFVVGVVVFVFQKINWVSLRCVRIVFFLLNKNCKVNNSDDASWQTHTH